MENNNLAMIAEIPSNKVRIAVLLTHFKASTDVPSALKGCPKRRDIIICSLSKTSDKERVGDGMAYRRPMDKFNAKTGATVAFRKAVDRFCQADRFKEEFDSEHEVRQTLWDQFIKTKAWKRINYGGKTKQSNSQ